MESFLSEINSIIKSEREAKIERGEDFNVFSVLGMESKENKTHSSFIAALLNPNGPHHQGDSFLRLFLDKLKEVSNDRLDNFNSLEHVKVYKEFHIGKVDKNYKNGGSIDIVIKSGDSLISIENKIYARDQKNQLERYVNYQKSNNKVFYLTLDGRPYKNPNNQEELKEEYYCLSYKYHIKDWLESCLDKLENPNQHILKINIQQYILLIKKLTGQMEDHEYKNLKAVITKNFSAAQSIADNIDKVKNDILKNFMEQLASKLSELKDKKGNEVIVDYTLKNGFILSVYLKNHEKSDAVSISVYPFDLFKNFGLSKGCISYGIRIKDGDEKNAKIIDPKTTNFWWPKHLKYGEENNGDGSEVIDLLSNKTFELLTQDDFIQTQTEILSKKIKSLMDEYYDKMIRIN